MRRRTADFLQGVYITLTTTSYTDFEQCCDVPDQKLRRRLKGRRLVVEHSEYRDKLGHRSALTVTPACEQEGVSTLSRISRGLQEIEVVQNAQPQNLKPLPMQWFYLARSRPSCHDMVDLLQAWLLEASQPLL
jgi:hypothetical protein